MKLPIKPIDSKVNFSVRMTPLIDVVFLLLVFLVMTIRLQKPETVLENILPQSGEQGITDQQKDWETVRLGIKHNKDEKRVELFLQERPLENYQDLLLYLNMLPEQIMIVIDPELTVPYKNVIGVYNTCIKAKKKNIVFAVTSP